MPNVTLTGSTVLAGLVMALGAAPMARAQDALPESETYAIHGQSTATDQAHGAFTSPYQGAQSFTPGANGRETVDVTLYLGFRPWQGAELWYNPEIDQGFGLSNALGIAGDLSGEAYKVGSVKPYYLTQRLFFRQTVNLGEATEAVESDINQLAGARSPDRLVFTAGKFSVVDVFDTNDYAHDPRHDFLNWSIIDQGAFDYAANAWGYTYGAAGEWYQDWWTLRLGAFAMSSAPNAKNVDGGLSQIDYVTELEERHTIGDAPGKLKLLYWLARGRFGDYLDAIAQAQGSGQAPATGDVRQYRGKYGFGLNLQQEIMPDLGAFLRASASQGSVEELDFSDINQSLSTGLSWAGRLWARPDDKLGLAMVVNRISHQAKEYFADGGIGGIIGDGRLPNAGAERIGEAYYSLAAFSFGQVSADYQYVTNPAYNRDRGPISIFGVRLHGEF